MLAVFDDTDHEVVKNPLVRFVIKENDDIVFDKIIHDKHDEKNAISEVQSKIASMIQAQKVNGPMSLPVSLNVVVCHQQTYPALRDVYTPPPESEI